MICKCINTPVKRQYINAHFKMAVYHRKRVATIINFFSFISIDIKISKPVKIFLPNLNGSPLIAILINDQKLMIIVTLVTLFL